MSDLLGAAEAVIDALDKVSYRLPGPEHAALRAAVKAAKATGPSDTEILDWLELNWRLRGWETYTLRDAARAAIASGGKKA